MANWLSPLTDAIGLTDSKAGSRAQSAMEQGQATADQRLDTDLLDTFGQLRDASAGRSLAQNLNKFNFDMGLAGDLSREGSELAKGQTDAGSASNVREYLNPMMEGMLDATAQRVQGGAGAALQSSATNKDVSRAVASQAGNLWEQAFNNAMADASNNLGVSSSLGNFANQGAGFAGTNLGYNNQPMEDLLSLENDRAMQRYAANTGMTQANMNLQGQRDTIL